MPERQVGEHTPTPWHVMAEITSGNYGPTAHYEIRNEDGKALADTYNSEVAVIEEEDDEGSAYRWDEQGRQDAAFICLAVNSHDDLVAALKRCEAALDAFLGCHTDQEISDSFREFATAKMAARAALAAATKDKTP